MTRKRPTGFEIALALLAGACLLELAVRVFSGELGEPVVEARARCLAAVLAGALLLLARRLDARRPGRRSLAAYVAAAALGVAAFYNFGLFRHYNDFRFINTWEQFHYQLGSKYFPELGYDGIYLASLAAQRESRPQRALPETIRDLQANRLVPVRSQLPQLEAVKSRFSAERWERFVTDHDHYLQVIEPAVLDGMRRDHGYNPPPSWTFVARMFSSRLPASRASLSFLAGLDVALMVLAFGMVLRSFGARAGCLALVVFGLGHGWNYIFVGALLRLDWLAALMLALCQLKRGRSFSAGALLGAATMARLFPAFFLLGPAVLGARELWQRRRPDAALRLAAGFGVAVMVGLAAGCFTGRGSDAWLEFAQDIRHHAGTWAPTSVGLESVVVNLPVLAGIATSGSIPNHWPVPPRTAERQLEARRPVLLALKGAFLSLVVAAAWSSTPVRAATLGAAATFALTPLASYYWVLLLLLPLTFGAPAALGVLALSAGVHSVDALPPPLALPHALMSLGMGALLLLICVRAALPSGRTTKGSARGAAGPQLLP